eukprot:scaffold3727_cov259-Ochromonas_danica.AAC.2
MSIEEVADNNNRSNTWNMLWRKFPFWWDFRIFGSLSRVETRVFGLFLLRPGARQGENGEKKSKNMGFNSRRSYRKSEI